MTAEKTTHGDRVGREIRRAGQPRGLSFSGSDKNALDSPAGSVDVYESPEFKTLGFRYLICRLDLPSGVG